jgi:L-lactate dehydrogenase complex protein LldF
MLNNSNTFPANAREAMLDPNLQAALGKLKGGFPVNRAKAVARLPEFDALRDEGKRIKDHVLGHLDFYLERFETKVAENGGQVHWARTPAEARVQILEICQRLEAKSVTKGKSMIGEEIGINDFLEEHDIRPVETDLGEYIIQLRKEPPSHIIAPAIHVSKEQVADAFRAAHQDLDPNRSLKEARDLTDEARQQLRAEYGAATVGITGANMLIAETGSSIIVTNEGNGDLTQSLAKAHIVIASLEKIVPTLEDAATVLRLLARSSTGQEFSVYTTISSGAKRIDDPDGPEEYHVILLDNGRSAMLGTEFQDMLRCIRCAACMNHCPVYAAVGGHAYGWVYPGPMGSVLTPTLIGVEKAGHLPNASTFCGKCEAVCPMRIPLPKMMRHYRKQEYDQGLSQGMTRFGIAAWSVVARRPKLYRMLTGLMARALRNLGIVEGRLTSLPFAGGWTSVRDLPAPEGRTFHALYKERRS